MHLGEEHVRAPARSIRSPCTMRRHIVTIAQRYARSGWARPAHDGKHRKAIAMSTTLVPADPS